MNDHDRKNLEFLLNAKPNVLLDWYHAMDEDDHMYAMDLLEVARLEIIDQLVEVQNDCTDANRLLKNIFQ